MISVSTHDATIEVKGSTQGLASVLGCRGLGFKYNRNSNKWTGRLSLKALRTLETISGAMLSPESLDEIAMMVRAAEKRAAYMAARRQRQGVA